MADMEEVRIRYLSEMCNTLQPGSLLNRSATVSIIIPQRYASGQLSMQLPMKVPNRAADDSFLTLFLHVLRSVVYDSFQNSAVLRVARWPGTKDAKFFLKSCQKGFFSQ